MDNRRIFPIRPAKRNEWEDAMALAWRTFMKFEAPDYSERGRDSFLEFISDEGLYKMFLLGEYHLFVALDDKKIVGIVALRARTHISLLFVDEMYHRQGLGRSLINYAAMYVAEEIRENIITVNAAPYATEFYHKVGFKDAGPMEENDGIRYTPMLFSMEKL